MPVRVPPLLNFLFTLLVFLAGLYWLARTLVLRAAFENFPPGTRLPLPAQILAPAYVTIASWLAPVLVVSIAFIRCFVSWFAVISRCEPPN